MSTYKMLTKLKFMAAAILGPALIALAFTGCLFDPPTVEPPEGPLEMTSPVNVLKNIQVSYNSRDIDLYKRAQSPNFVFFFDPDDVGQQPPGKTYEIPESWTYTEDWRATRNMFSLAYSISLSISTGNVGEPEETATTYKAENVKISLLVYVDQLNGFIAGNYGYCNFEFESYENSQGKKLWRLRKWWDYTAQPV